jgi:hypothetical protein
MLTLALQLQVRAQTGAARTANKIQATAFFRDGRRAQEVVVCKSKGNSLQISPFKWRPGRFWD